MNCAGHRTEWRSPEGEWRLTAVANCGCGGGKSFQKGRFALESSNGEKTGGTEAHKGTSLKTRTVVGTDRRGGSQEEKKDSKGDGEELTRGVRNEGGYRGGGGLTQIGWRGKVRVKREIDTRKGEEIGSNSEEKGARRKRGLAFLKGRDETIGTTLKRRFSRWEEFAK